MNRIKKEPYQLGKKQLKNIQDMYDESDVKMYFESRSPVLDNVNHLTSKHFADKIVTGIDVLITMGELGISKPRKKIDELMDQTTIGEEESKALQLKAKKQYIEQQLEYLRHQTTLAQPSSEEKIADSKIVLSKEQHKRVIQKLKKQRALRAKNHSQFLNKLQSQRCQAEQMQRKNQQQSKKEQLRRRREMIESNLQKNKKSHEQFLRIQHESKQKIKDIKNKRFVYQKIQQKYEKNIVLPNLQQKKRKLKEIRQYTSFNVSDIREHQRSYMQHQKLQQSRRSQVKQSWHYRPPHRSERLQIIIEEERLAKMQMLEDKKKQLQDKITRQDNYVSYLREHFHPKIDPLKEQEIKMRIEKSRIAKPEAGDIKQIGMTYLQHAKKIRKMGKTIDARPETQRDTTNLTSRTLKDTENDTKPRSVTNYLTIDRNRDEHFYQQVRKKRLEKLAKQEGISQSDRIKQLKIEADKINEKMMRKQKQAKYKQGHKLKQESLDLLLSSIQAKIGIIQMYQ